jgi:hypothetical protein
MSNEKQFVRFNQKIERLVIDRRNKDRRQLFSQVEARGSLVTKQKDELKQLFADLKGIGVTISAASELKGLHPVAINLVLRNKQAFIDLMEANLSVDIFLNLGKVKTGDLTAIKTAGNAISCLFKQKDDVIRVVKENGSCVSNKILALALLDVHANNLSSALKDPKFNWDEVKPQVIKKLKRSGFVERFEEKAEEPESSVISPKVQKINDKKFDVNVR